jgi:hypothetical protein
VIEASGVFYSTTMNSIQPPDTSRPHRCELAIFGIVAYSASETCLEGVAGREYFVHSMQSAMCRFVSRLSDLASRYPYLTESGARVLAELANAAAGFGKASPEGPAFRAACERLSLAAHAWGELNREDKLFRGA